MHSGGCILIDLYNVSSCLQDIQNNRHSLAYKRWISASPDSSRKKKPPPPHTQTPISAAREDGRGTSILPLPHRVANSTIWIRSAGASAWGLLFRGGGGDLNDFWIAEEKMLGGWWVPRGEGRGAYV